MFKTLSRSTALALCLIANAAHADEQNYPFKLISQQEAGKQTIAAQNKGPAPILLTLKLTSDDAIVEPSSTIVAVVKPSESVAVAALRGKTPGHAYSVASSYKFSIGDPDAGPSEAISYHLPFPAGQSIMIRQILGGKITTHSGPDSKYAVDFDVPIGTPVLAARKGIVVDIEQGHTAGGNDPRLKANHVLILHEDGTLAVYSHLAPDSHAVAFGQSVEAGALIGYSGNTGYSSGPHLHFAVLTNTRSEDGTARYVSHPVKFANGSPSRTIELSQDQVLVVNEWH
jgi:murein DD-endopeptidase MepM/ murein hydrolase activator NlpD